MNSKRKADLHRRLSLTPVPKPPADLADRIKADIPEYLRPDADRQRLTRSVAFNMRVAASILLVVSSVVAAVYLLAPEDAMRQASRPATAMVADHKSVSPTDELQIEIAEQVATESATVQLADAARARTVQATPRRAVEVAASAREDGSVGSVALTANTGAAAAESIAAVAEAPPAIAQESMAKAAAPAPVPAAPAPEPVAATASAPRLERQQKLATPSLAREAYAADLDLRAPGSVFGISLDPSIFHRIRETLEKNERPVADAVDVEAIINYFAGAPAKPQRDQLRFEVEGSPSPLAGIGGGGYLRFTIDTPGSESRLPFAADAQIEVVVNDKVVTRITPIGDAPLSAQEKVLMHNLSVTGLYELTLKSNVRSTEKVATVRFSYRNIATGKRHSEQRAIYVRDFGKVWTAATRRHRVASLGAVWAESLIKASWLAGEVVRRADELAIQHPRDERAQELATAANASSKLPATSF